MFIDFLWIFHIFYAYPFPYPYSCHFSIPTLAFRPRCSWIFDGFLMFFDWFLVDSLSLSLSPIPIPIPSLFLRPRETTTPSWEDFKIQNRFGFIIIYSFPSLPLCRPSGNKDFKIYNILGFMIIPIPIPSLSLRPRETTTPSWENFKNYNILGFIIIFVPPLSLCRPSGNILGLQNS